MKSIKSKAIVTLAALSLFIAAPAALAGNGNGPGNGSGPIHNITDGDSVVIAGNVTSTGTKGNGIEIDTGPETTTVYGIGPVGFWGAEEIERPAVGDEITVNGYKVTLPDDSTKIISGSINNGEQEITLRDDDGAPLWRGGAAGNKSGGVSEGRFGQGGGLEGQGRRPLQ